jgi:hypothetical protein
MYWKDWRKAATTPVRHGTLTRRAVLGILSAAGTTHGQGVASRSVTPTPRGKPSGLPWRSKLVDVASEAGLVHPSIYGDPMRKRYITETVGAGVAFFDYDNDGWLDVFVLSGTRGDGSTPTATNRLYKNNRDGTFQDVTEKAGLVRNGWASAVTIGDYNNDGWEDLFITYYGQNALYRNNGDGTFTDVTEKAGLRGAKPAFGGGCTWVDIDRDGKLDLFIANYVDYADATATEAGANANCQWKGVPVVCGPRGLKTARCQLYRNNGDGTFRDISEPSKISQATGSYAMTAVAGDFDNDGWPDIYVACDSTPSYLFRNRKDGTFAEEGLERGAAVSEDGMEQAGMGVAVGDYNLDGHLDLFKTHFADDTNVLYRNDGKGNFTDVTSSAGIGVETRYTGWGTGLADLDNDGLPDLFVVTGSVYPEVEKRLPSYPHATPRLVFRNLGQGRFEELLEEAGPGVSAPHSSRGCAFGDFDNDGDVDILIFNMNQPPSLLRNDVSGKGHWLKVRLEGTKSNRSAIGARVTVHYGNRIQTQEVHAQSSFYSVNDRRLHFGLGDVALADVNIRWPNGDTERISRVAADRLIWVREGAGVIPELSVLKK